MNKDFLDLVQQKHVGNGSVGPSTAWGMGPAGTINAAKRYFYKFDLRSIKARSETTFVEKLNVATEELRDSLPREGRYWGSSRKFLNIFLRNCLYNRYLCDYYQLHKIEEWLEVPLDSHVGKGLKLEPEGLYLPRWRTVIGLTPDLSDKFQEVAKHVAIRKKIARVHLDIFYWRGAHVASKSINRIR